MSGRSMSGAASPARIAGAATRRRTSAVPTGAVIRGGNRKAPTSDSVDRVTPTAKKPIGTSRKTSTWEASTRRSGASASGAMIAATSASSGGLRRKNEAVRSRAPVPAVEPKAAPTANTATNRTGALTTAS